MSTFPEDLKYASTHEWVKIDDEGIATIGISDHAQDALGDIVFIELPAVGTDINAKDEVAVVESVKAASDIYSPLSGEIIAVNEELADSPEIVNATPYDNGWFYKIRPSNEAELDDLLDATAYAEMCEGE
ncbi:MAG: glycine cleavage system protein H [SAR86 cluster bacterium]|uniref:Glycine cleavage system H protein n=1 Tax=SAR86 cluster bacterium TaxID=2030880 RepID=A0A2A4MT94_9GAMM|nr:MAG: glycine cleavage system protein H [SAR86 cluster bacterium]